MNHFQVKVRHPRRRTIHNISIDKNQCVRDVKLTILKEFHLVSTKLDDVTLVIGPSPNSFGVILNDETPFDESLIKIDKDILEIYRVPEFALVCISDGSSYIKANKLLIDFGSPLNDSIPSILSCLVNKHANEQYVFQSVRDETITWINSNRTLNDLGFDKDNESLCLYPVKEIIKRWQQLGRKEEKSGFMYFQQGSNIDSLDKKTKRWLSLVGIFLLVFKAKNDPFPSSIIPLDFYSLKIKRDEKFQSYILLKLVDKQFNLSKSKNCFALSDENNSKDVIESWYDSMRDKCINTGEKRVFGAPLLKLIYNDSNGIRTLPSIFTKTISYLDQRGLETEGIFRLNGNPSLTEHYRDEFELGLEPDLSECQDPHTIASLLKQFFRELPEPLLPFQYYYQFLDIADPSKGYDENEKVLRIFSLVENIPEVNLLILKHLLSFLNRVSRLSDINKMTVQNLAMVFGPNLLKPENDTPQTLMQDAARINEIVELLIKNENLLTHSTILKRSRASVYHHYSGSNNNKNNNNNNSSDGGLQQSSSSSNNQQVWQSPSIPPKKHPIIPRRDIRGMTVGHNDPNKGYNNNMDGGSWSQKADFFRSENAKQTLNSTPPIWKSLSQKEGILSYKSLKSILWKERYAVLSPSTLYLFKSLKEKNNGEPNSVIPLKDAKIQIIFQGGRNVLKIVVLSGIVFFFYTKSQNELDEWKKAIEDKINRLNDKTNETNKDIDEEEKIIINETMRRKEVRRSMKQSSDLVLKKIDSLETLVYKQSVQIANLEEEVRKLKLLINKQ